MIKQKSIRFTIVVWSSNLSRAINSLSAFILFWTALILFSSYYKSYFKFLFQLTINLYFSIFFLIFKLIIIIFLYLKYYKIQYIFIYLQSLFNTIAIKELTINFFILVFKFLFLTFFLRFIINQNLFKFKLSIFL